MPVRVKDLLFRFHAFLWPVVILAGIAGLLVVLLVAQRIATRRAVDAVVEDGQGAAVLLASSFRRELEKFRLTTVVLGRDPEARQALVARDPAMVAALNAKLASLSGEMKAAAVYLLDANGTTLAASNYRQPTSFVGLSYGFRSYFRDAMRNGSARQFALGTRSRTPGLYLAQRIDSAAGAPLGVIVIKAEFDALEAEWRNTRNTAFATNQRGIILVTSVPRWRFQTTVALDDATRRDIRSNLEFGDGPLVPNALFARDRVAQAGTGAAYARPLVETIQAVGEGWTIHVLNPTTAPVDAAVVTARLILLTLVMAATVLGALYVNRRRAAVTRTERRAAAHADELKHRLAQANKLATLGQIAAGVGHEVNQPVTAIGTYAHNSTLLIDAGREAEARENMTRIVALTQQIGSITGELRGFARRATGVSRSVSIDDAIAGALLLLGDRIRTTAARINYEPAGREVAVIAEHVRLEQVLVNLLQNALDSAGERSVIDIVVTLTGQSVEVAIGDDGPGLSARARADLFQPFSTTKPDGLGLGLVISRGIMVDFGGDLVAHNPPSGAEFVMRLQVAR